MTVGKPGELSASRTVGVIHYGADRRCHSSLR
jgi:hypothetical protein